MAENRCTNGSSSHFDHRMARCDAAAALPAAATLHREGQQGQQFPSPQLHTATIATRTPSDSLPTWPTPCNQSKEAAHEQPQQTTDACPRSGIHQGTKICRTAWPLASASSASLISANGRTPDNSRSTGNRPARHSAIYRGMSRAGTAEPI